MKTLESIKTRRSIRKYTNNKIDRNDVLTILEAAMYAPSARNYQPWHFVVIDDESLKQQLSKVHPYGGMLKDAAVGILVCGNTDLEPEISYLLQDCSAATQNLLLAAHDLGLGAVWLGVHPREQRLNAINELLNIAKNLVPIALISMGYPAESRETPQRFSQEKISFNKMGN